MKYFFQIYPQFVGWIIQLTKDVDLKQAVLTHLPPIEKPIRIYEAIVEIFTGSEQLPKQANIKYTHITLDFGLAIKEFMCSEINQKIIQNL